MTAPAEMKGWTSFMDQMECPDVRNYLSVSQFLEDSYRYRKSMEHGFSYESWAKRLGIKNRSYLRLLVGGKRLVPERLVERFCTDLELCETQSTHFRLLVEYASAKTLIQKDMIGRQLVSGLKHAFDRQQVERHHEFLASQILPKLQVLLSFNDLDRTPTSIAPLLEVSSSEIEKSLSRLKELGLAQEEDGHWKPLKSSFVVPEHLGDLALNIFHRRSLEEAIRAQHYPKEQRRYKSLLLALSEEEFQIFMNEVQAFIHQAIKKFDTSSMLGRRLFQFNCNLIPISAPAVESELIADPSPC